MIVTIRPVALYILIYGWKGELWLPFRLLAFLVARENRFFISRRLPRYSSGLVSFPSLRGPNYILVQSRSDARGADSESRASPLAKTSRYERNTFSPLNVGLRRRTAASRRVNLPTTRVIKGAPIGDSGSSPVSGKREAEGGKKRRGTHKVALTKVVLNKLSVVSHAIISRWEDQDRDPTKDDAVSIDASEQPTTNGLSLGKKRA